MKKHLSIIFVILLILINISTVHATEKKLEVPIKENMESAVFLINWEKNVDADVVLIKPDGSTMTKAELNNAYVKEKNNVLIVINNPEIGDWQVIVKGEDTGKVTVSLNEIEEIFEISQFVVEKIDDTKFNLKWSTKNIEDRSISIHVYVDEDNEGYNGIEVSKFTGDISGSREITIDKLDWGNYYFYIKVVDSLGIDDYLYSDEAFEIISPNAPVKISAVKASVVEDNIKIQWEKPDNNLRNKYRIMIFEEGSSKPFYTEETEQNEFITPSIEGDKVQIAVAALGRNNVLGKYEKILVDMNKSKNIKASVNFPENHIINTMILPVPLEMEKGYKASIYINGEMIKENVLESGTITFQLNDGPNDLAIIVEDNQGNGKIFAKELYVDTYPPQLYVSKDYQGISTAEGSIVLSGEVEPNSKLFLNDKEIEYQDNGVFVYNMSLSIGKNEIVLKAVDIAGNTSYYYGNVNKTMGAEIVYYIILIFSIIVTIILMIFIFIKKKKQERSGGNKDEE